MAKKTEHKLPKMTTLFVNSARDQDPVGLKDDVWPQNSQVRGSLQSSVQKVSYHN